LRLIVGLGNPGPRYARTRHNVGALAIERAAGLWGIPLRDVDGFRKGRGALPAGPVTVAGPVAWMNESGPAVRALLDDLYLSPDRLVIVHDDLDLPAARIRVKQGGGAGGHNGLSSLIEALQSSEFTRIRIGIGRPAPEIDPADYVLSPFSKDEWPALQEVLGAAVEALEVLLADGVSAAMNQFNVRDPKPDKPVE
jgi:peptidyl-tRNA hydrolase, PTH1 family